MATPQFPVVNYYRLLACKFFSYTSEYNFLLSLTIMAGQSSPAVPGLDTKLGGVISGLHNRISSTILICYAVTVILPASRRVSPVPICHPSHRLTSWLISCLTISCENPHMLRHLDVVWSLNIPQTFHRLVSVNLTVKHSYNQQHNALARLCGE